MIEETNICLGNKEKDICNHNYHKKYSEYLRVIANSHFITFRALKTVNDRILGDFEAFSLLSSRVILRL